MVWNLKLLSIFFSYNLQNWFYFQCSDCNVRFASITNNHNNNNYNDDNDNNDDQFIVEWYADAAVVAWSSCIARCSYVSNRTVSNVNQSNRSLCLNFFLKNNNNNNFYKFYQIILNSISFCSLLFRLCWLHVANDCAQCSITILMNHWSTDVVR